MKNFFKWLFVGAMTACVILFLFLAIKEIITSANYQWQAKIITDKGSFWANYEKLDDGCLLIKNASNTNRTPYLYCGKYIINLPKDEK